MEIKSEPQYDTINVTDIDIAFPGDLQTYTLREGVDAYEITTAKPGDIPALNAGDLLTINRGGGALYFDLHKAHWWGICRRQIRVLAPDAPKVVAP